MAKETFENISNTGTQIEWGHAKVGTENSGSNLVGTSHQEGRTSVGSYWRDNGWTIKEFNHNHPSGSPFPSGIDNGGQTGDLHSASFYKNNVNFNVYVNGNKGKYERGYYPFDKKGVKW